MTSDCGHGAYLDLLLEGTVVALQGEAVGGLG